MAFRTRMKCVILLLLVTCIGHSYAKLESVPQLSNNELGNQGETEANTPGAKTLEDTVGLESILGREWETENKPLSDEELSSVFEDLFGSDGINEVESSTQSDSKPNNPEDITIVPNSQFDEQAINNEKNVIQNSKGPKEDSQQATLSSSDTPYFQGTNNLGSTLSVLQPKMETGIYATTTSSDGLKNINPYTIWPSIADDDNPTIPSFKINTPKYQYEPSQPSVTSTVFPIFSSDFSTDSQNGVSPTGSIIQAGIYTTTTPSNWYGSQGNTLRSDVVDDVTATNPSLKSDTNNDEHSTTHSFLSENQPEVKPTVPDLKSINSTYESSRPNNQNGIIVPIDPKPNIPKYNPEVLIRPGFGSHIRPHRPHCWPFGSNFGHGGHSYTSLRHRNNHWFERHGHNFQHHYQPMRPGFNLQHQKNFKHLHGGRYHNYHRHHYHPGFHGHYHNSFGYR